MRHIFNHKTLTEWLNVDLFAAADKKDFSLHVKQSSHATERTSYYRIAAVEGGKATGSIEIGVMETEASPIPFRAPEIRTIPAIKMYFDRHMNDAIRVLMALGDTAGSHMFGFDRPQTVQQTELVLRLMGEAIQDISSGKAFDFGKVYVELKKMGLKDLGNFSRSLLADSPAIAAYEQALRQEQSLHAFGRLKPL